MKVFQKTIFFLAIFFIGSTTCSVNLFKETGHAIKNACCSIADIVSTHVKGKAAIEALDSMQTQADASIEIAKAGAQVAAAATAASPSVANVAVHAATITQQIKDLNNATAALNAATNNIQNAATTLHGAIETTKDTATTLQKAQEVVISAGKHLSKLDILLGVGAVCTIAKSSYDFYHWSKSQMYPSDENQLKDEMVKEKLEILRIRKLLRASIIKNSSKKCDESGFPLECKDLANKLAMFGGEEELNEIIKQFKNRYGNQ